MTDRKKLIIKNTWSYAITQSEMTGELFYERLFELDPSLKAMFPTNMDQQVKKLMDMMTYMVSRLQMMPEIQQEMDAMAVRHKGYGVRKEHYITLGEALIWVLQERLGEQWNEETNAAWTELYSIWSTSMINAAEKAS